MALLQCPDCQRDVSDQATSCPNCGRPMRGAATPPAAVSSKGTGKALVLLGTVAMIAGVLTAVLGPGVLGGLIMLVALVVFVVGRFMS